ncbi:MAG: restriction endonuclease subunit S [Ruminiclostridium sp.]|nr:restriction endonuclease subunit S [Ruminiclostridium sp.]
MTSQELRASILQLAIQGKLVEQRKEEGTGEELYQQIQAKKQVLNKAGPIKIQKSLTDIAGDEIPFDIPETWKWVRLLSVIEIATNLVQPVDYPDYMHIAPDNIEKATGRLLECHSVKSDKVSSANHLFYKGQIIYSKIRPLLRKAVIAPFDGLCSADMYPLNTTLDTKYVLYYLLSDAYNVQIAEAMSSRVKMPKINQTELSHVLLPLPPLAEQKRIVAKIEELLPYIDRYEQAWSKLEEFNKRFPVDMQKSILQTAIQGKLVEQRPEEGTGEELYQQIQAEKQALIKAGTIKKQKPLPEIAENELPFDIPENWKWVRLRDIISVLGDGIHGTPIFDETGEYYFVNGNNLVKGSIVFKADTKKVSADEYAKHKKPLDKNTILISINGTIGNYAFYAGEPIVLGKSACYFSVLTGIEKEYIRHLINTKFFMDYAVKEATQTTIKNVSLKAMRMFPVPLPPLNEQKRIVAKLEELLPLCDHLK